MKADSDMMFEAEVDYIEFKKWVTEELDDVKLSDFVVDDVGLNGGAYFMRINYQATVDIFGEGFIRDPEFNIIFP